MDTKTPLMDSESLSDSPHQYYSSVIKISGWTFAIITGILAAIIVCVLLTQSDDSETSRRVVEGGSRRRSPLPGFILMPLGGYLLGVALAILVAPSSYLRSAEGKQWIELVGVKSVWLSRLVTLTVSIFGLAFFSLLALALLTDNFKKPIFYFFH